MSAFEPAICWVKSNNFYGEHFPQYETAEKKINHSSHNFCHAHTDADTVRSTHTRKPDDLFVQRLVWAKVFANPLFLIIIQINEPISGWNLLFTKFSVQQIHTHTVFHSQAGTHVRAHRHNVSSLQNNLITCSTSRDRLCEWTKCSRIWVKAIQAKERVGKKTRRELFEHFVSDFMTHFDFSFSIRLRTGELLSKLFIPWHVLWFWRSLPPLLLLSYSSLAISILLLFKTHLISAKFRSS